MMPDKSKAAAMDQPKKSISFTKCYETQLNPIG